MQFFMPKSYNSHMAKIIVVLGPPGSGKSTLSERFANLSGNELVVFHISAGNCLRDIRTGVRNSVFEPIINSSNASSPLRHEVVNGVIFESISRYPENSLVIVDGYPMFPDAIEHFLTAIDKGNHTLLGCISLEISLENSRQRLSARGRRNGERIVCESDSEFAERRYRDYLDYTKNAIEKLGKIIPVIDINAESNLDEVYDAYNNAIMELISKI